MQLYIYIYEYSDVCVCVLYDIRPWISLSAAENRFSGPISPADRPFAVYNNNNNNNNYDNNKSWHSTHLYMTFPHGMIHWSIYFVRVHRKLLYIFIARFGPVNLLYGLYIYIYVYIIKGLLYFTRLGGSGYTYITAHA